MHTPWGAAIDFRRPEVRDFFTHNALYWLNEYRFRQRHHDSIGANDTGLLSRDLADGVA